MKPITARDPESHSPDLVAENLAHLRALLPEAFTEGQINFEVLKQLLGGAVDEREEKYGLNWHGKRQARQLALTPSTGTLRPCPEESVAWDSTQNLMIEGDNLEVLKLLQKSYAGKVKLIYIDPPYNTGKDFIYPDDFRDNIKNYLELTGQTDGEGRKLSTNTEASGRFHTAWLNMIYPRLKLARNLLRDDGVIFISIDDHEAASLIAVCSEIFGEENFIGAIAVQVNPRGRHLDKFLARTHDWLLVFAKNAAEGNPVGGKAKSGVMLEDYQEGEGAERFRLLGLRNRNQSFNPQTRPNLFFPLYVDPAGPRISLDKSGPFTDEVWPIAPDGTKTCWTWSRNKVACESQMLTARRHPTGEWRIYRRDNLVDENGAQATTLSKSLWLDSVFSNDIGRKSVKELFGQPVMDFPKSPELVTETLLIGCSGDGLVLDFFAGSGTTGHAVAAQNAADGGTRRYILVQLPEPTGRADYPTIADICKVRLRRAGAKVRAEKPMFAGDLGFRVFKLDSSNIKAWDPDRDNLAGEVQSSIEHLKADRSEQDILYEVLLKLDLDLSLPIEERTIAGKAVQSIGAGTLFACLAPAVAAAEVEPLALGIAAWRQEIAPAGEATVIFRDSAFADDVAKTNYTAILQQHGFSDGNIRSL